jgi:Xaa-Pro aminopeptidase
MLSHAKAILLNAMLSHRDASLVNPSRNLVDLIWKDKPSPSKGPIYIQGLEFTGRETGDKLAELREWIKAQSTSVISDVPANQQECVGTLISSLPNIGKCS